MSPIGAAHRTGAALVVAAAAAACASGEARTVLTVASWASWSEQRLEAAYVHRFEELNPGLGVSLTPALNAAEYRDQILTSIAAGAPPDVFLLDNIDVPALVAANVTLDLAPYAERAGIRLDAFEPRVLDIFRSGSRIVAFPKGYTPIVLAFNRDMFDAAGVPYPRADWTWDEFLAAARALTRDTDGDGETDTWGFWLDRRPFLWIPSLWSLGGDILCADGRRASGCLDSPQSIAAFRELLALATREHVTPRFFGLRRTVGDHLRMFASGRVAMIPIGHFYLPALRPHLEAGRLRMGVSFLPRRAGGEPATVIYASGFAVPAAARHKRLSVRLAAFMVDSLAQHTRSSGGLEIPALRSAAALAASRDSSGLESVFVAATRHGRLPWGARIAPWREVESVLPDIFDRVLLRGEDVAAVLRDIAPRIDAIVEPGRVVR